MWIRLLQGWGEPVVSRGGSVGGLH